MSRLEKIVLIFLFTTLFFSENTGKAFLYSCCLLNIFEQKRFLLIFSVISMVFDIYHSSFVGISFLSLAIVVSLVKKFKSVLSNLSIFVRLYYLLVIVCGAELISGLFVILFGGKLDFYSHFLIVIKSMIFCYVLESLREHAKRS